MRQFLVQLQPALTPQELTQPVDDALQSMHWLYDLPTWLLGFLMLASWVSLSLLGLFLIHQRWHRHPLSSQVDNGTVGWFFSGVSLLYGLLLGLLTVATWSNFSQASNIVSQEAATIAVVYRDLTGYPQPQQNQLKKQLYDYTQFIVQKSWPAQRQGFVHWQEGALLEPFQNSLLTLEPQSEAQKIVHTEAIGAFNRLVELRRQRLESLKGSVPGVLWSVVILGGLLTIVFSYLFVVKHYGLHALLTGLLAAMIGLLIFLLVVLDHPYWGEVSVSPEAYERVIDSVMKRN